MNSSLYTGEIRHHRLAPLEHHFRHKCYFYALDLAELERLDRDLAGFGYNRLRPVSLRDEDYLERNSESLTTKVYRLLQENAHASRIKQILLVTGARYFNHAFNPVSFYLCFDQARRLDTMITEVNNTFGEKHVYVLTDFQREGLVWKPENMERKAFHVSPFNDLGGEYEFEVMLDEHRLRIDVNLHREGCPILLTSIAGRTAPLTTGSLWRTIAGMPFRALLTMPRIMLEAGKLHCLKSLGVHRKPNPVSPMTTGRSPKWRERLYLRLLAGALKHIKYGCLKLELPDRRVMAFGDSNTGPTHTLRILNYAFFKRVLKGGAVAFGECFVDGDCDTEDLTGVLELFVCNTQAMQAGHSRMNQVVHKANRALHIGRHNNRENARNNIQFHYDLGNDFYETFLDPTMTYSNGIFAGETDTLEAAQHRKLRAMIEKADIQAHHHVLEIGSGWGSFAIEAARTTGCRVTSITLSEEQCKLARERVQAAGLDDQVEIMICDYRDVKGSFDRVVSIEMLEAVGHEYYDTFFSTVNSLLKPDGKVAIQVITIPAERYKSYCNGCDWIQKYIFPGGLLPSIEILKRSIARATDLQWCGEENLGMHYARTCRAWRENFLARREQVEALGFDASFQRKWIYYLSYSEAGFAQDFIHVHQFVLEPMPAEAKEPGGVLETAG
jgi:cyclopropane-fatty-acyl-phospholipid synthase